MKYRFSALFAVFILSACGTETAPEPTANSPVDDSAELASLLDDYFERNLVLSPTSATSIGDDRYDNQYANSIGPEHRAARHELNKEFLARLEAVDRAALSTQEQHSYDMFKLQREMSLASEQYPGHLAPMNQFRSATSSFVNLGSGSGLHPFNTVQNYDDFLGRVDGFVVYVDQAIANMKEGVQQGVTQPKVLMQKYVPQVESQLVDSAEESGFYTPITNLPENFSDEDRDRLTAAYTDAIENKIIPAYSRIANFMHDEYLEAARDSVGLLDLPNGDAWYAHNVRSITTTDLTPDEIHQIGLDEVARIHGEMRGVMEYIGFDGSLQEFFKYVYDDPQFFFDEPEQLIQRYRDMSAHIEGLAPKLFETFPKTAFEVRRVEPFREASSSKGSYQSGSPDGSRPGVFYANAYNVGVRPKWDMQSLYLHEAIPGHHYQIMLQRENEDLPRFRRFGGFTAYIEGWGLYAESLGKEIGVYTDPMDYFGSLNAELWRSIRLVTDTGIHAKGWTRQEVLDYMYANSAVSETRAVSEAERFMAIPGQALAYKIGMLKIREIRASAEAALGDNFDVRAFHTQILNDGAMPLSMLETKLEAWVQSQL
ncbi:MAG: DUF885 domain-containing protein [Woeseiaceae bacterium]